MGDVEKLVKECTSDLVTSADWGAFMRIVDIVNNNAHKSKQIMKYVEKRLQQKKDARVHLLALELLEAIVKNCPCAHPVVGSTDFQKTLVKLLTAKKTRDDVKTKGLELVMVWNHAFQGFDKRIYHYCSAHQHRRANAAFLMCCYQLLYLGALRVLWLACGPW